MWKIFKIEKKIDNLNKLYRITDKPIDLITEPYEFDAVRFKMQKPLYIGNKNDQGGLCWNYQV